MYVKGESIMKKIIITIASVCTLCSFITLNNTMATQMVPPPAPSAAATSALSKVVEYFKDSLKPEVVCAKSKWFSPRLTFSSFQGILGMNLFTAALIESICSPNGNAAMYNDWKDSDGHNNAMKILAGRNSHDVLMSYVGSATGAVTGGVGAIICKLSDKNLFLPPLKESIHNKCHPTAAVH
jgi:hypothetical protein